MTSLFLSRVTLQDSGTALCLATDAPPHAHSCGRKVALHQAGAAHAGLHCGLSRAALALLAPLQSPGDPPCLALGFVRSLKVLPGDVLALLWLGGVAWGRLAEGSSPQLSVAPACSSHGWAYLATGGSLVID